MKSQYKLGQTYRAKNNETTKELDMKDEFSIVIQEKKENKNLILLTINSRKNYTEKTTRFYDGPDSYFEEAEINAMDLLQDEICIKEHRTGTLIYGDAILFEGNNVILEFTPIGTDLMANVQFTIRTISGELLEGFLYCSLQPKNYFLGTS
jgi:hypothetical protein